jgi:hypothetical protein
MILTKPASAVQVGDELYRRANDSTTYVNKIVTEAGGFISLYCRGWTRDNLLPETPVEVYLDPPERNTK